MMADRTRAFKIGQYLIDPSKHLISGAAGVSNVPAPLMNVLVQLANSSQEYVSSRQLIESMGLDPQNGSPDLEVMIRTLLKLLGEDPEDSHVIIKSVTGHYKLCHDIVYIKENDTAVVPTKPDVEFEHFVQELSDSKESPGSPQSHRESATPPAGEIGWFEALKRRRVFRAMGAYAAVSWLILQIASLLVGAFPAVPLNATAVAAKVLLIAFPLVMLLVWLIQVTPSGLEIDLERGAIKPPLKKHIVHLIDVGVIGVLLVVVAILSYERYKASKHTGVSIAVLAFTNSSDQEGDQYLGVGISDNIRSRLAGVDKLLVAAPPSRELQPSQELSVQRIGERLEVDHVLYGSVRRASDRVQLDVHLVNVSTGFSQWGKSYDVSLDDMLKVNSNISLYVASELEVFLTQELRRSLAGNPTEVPAAYEAYLEGRSYLELPRTNRTIAKAMLFFNEAIAKDPLFALAYAGLCDAFTAMYLDSADVRAMDLAEGSCRTALKLDDTLSPVRVAMGNLFFNSGRLDEALEAYQMALVLDQNSLAAITGLGDVYNARGDFSSAENQYRFAIDKLPNNWNGYNLLARFLLSRGRYEEAAENYRHVLAFTPNNVNAYNNLGASYILMEDFSKAANNFRRSLQLEPNAASYANTGSMYYFDGDFNNALAMYKKAVELAPLDYRYRGNLADVQRFLPNALEDSQASYAQAIEMAEAQSLVNPDDVEIHSNLAYYLANIGDKEGAMLLLEQIGLTPNLNPEYQYTNALTFRLLGDELRSSQALSEAIIQGFPEAVINATPELKRQK